MVPTVTAMEAASFLVALSRPLQALALAVAIAPLILQLELHTLELTAQSSFFLLLHQFRLAEISQTTAQLAKQEQLLTDLDAIGALDLPLVTMAIF